MSPAMQTQQDSSQFPSDDHEETYNSLSEKNQKAYDALDGQEQDQVVETYKKGGNCQKTLSEILKKDQKQYDKSQKNGTGATSSATTSSTSSRPSKDMSNTPAANAMKKQSESKDDNDDENVFNDS